MTGDNVVDSATGLTWERSFGDLTDYPTGESECAAWGGRIPTGDRPGAVRSLARAVALDPDHRRARSLLDRLARTP